MSWFSSRFGVFWCIFRQNPLPFFNPQPPIHTLCYEFWKCQLIITYYNYLLESIMIPVTIRSEESWKPRNNAKYLSRAQQNVRERFVLSNERENVTKLARVERVKENLKNKVIRAFGTRILSPRLNLHPHCSTLISSSQLTVITFPGLISPIR